MRSVSHTQGTIYFIERTNAPDPETLHASYRHRLGGNIYPALAVRVTDETILGRLSKRRTIYELVPR